MNDYDACSENFLKFTIFTQFFFATLNLIFSDRTVRYMSGSGLKRPFLSHDHHTSIPMNEAVLFRLTSLKESLTMIGS